jgi:hypothetical protein
MKFCKKCITPANHPKANFDSNGVCSFCRDWKPNEIDLKKYENDLEQTLKNVKGEDKYDCLLLFSGGKDSAYLMHQLVKEYNLRVLAFTVDIGFETKLALDNTRDLRTKLDVDHVWYTPKKSFYIKLYKHILTTDSKNPAALRWFDSETADQDRMPFTKKICYVCGFLLIGYGIRYAAYNNIPLVIGGHALPMPDNFFYTLPEEDINSDWTPDEIYQAPFTEEDRSYFWNPQREKNNIKILPEFITPYHVWHYDPEDVRDKCKELNLLSKKKSNPIYTNCNVNTFCYYHDSLIDNYLPFVREMGDVVREKKYTRHSLLLIRLHIWILLKLCKLPIMNKIYPILEIYSVLGIKADDIVGVNKKS